MFASLSAFRSWVCRHLTLANSLRAWQERLGLLALAGVAMLLWYQSERLSAPLQAALWSVLVLAAAALSRRGWFTLFGPVLFHELVRIARRRRYFLVRGLYAFTLALIFLWVWFLWSISPGASRELSPREMAEIAESFFTTFIITQFAIVTLLVPAMAGGAIAEEKERRTLEFLLATDLRNREIVLGKLAARLGNVVLLVLAGLPILSLIQFFGGVDPDLLLTSFAGLGVTILSLTSLATLFSVLLRRARDAILLTYLTIATYLAVGAFGIYLSATGIGVTVPLTFGSNPVTFGDLLDWFNAGNPFSVAAKAVMSLMGNQSLSAVLPELFTEYVVFHLVIVLLCVGLAVLRLRVVALRQTTGKTRAVTEKLPLHLRPRVRAWPMLWKEVRVEGRLRFGWFGTVVLGVLVLASLVPIAFALASLVREALYTGDPWAHIFGISPIHGFDYSYSLREELHNWVRFLGAAVASLMLIGVAVRAAGSVSGERDRQTLDSLLTTPLEPSAILGAKWLGAILSVRRGWLWLGTFWAVGLATQSLEVLGVLLAVLAWFIYAAGCAAVGLWFSLICKTTLRATVWTLVSVVFLGGAHWIASGLFVFLPMEMLDLATPQTVGQLMELQMGQTVPVALGVFAFHSEDFADQGEFLRVFFASLVSLFLWGLATLVLGQLLSVKFCELTGRIPLKHSTRSRERGQPGKQE